ncbi:hypothetical protein [Chitinophaga agri]|uniref:Lipoprotein n=1 Tax=Chitinophaga agri TaxID=2703787 RepID=A0A6B9ZHU7_9BACT|nr:hypothetical protein [Chitinophaga agri]QHS62018.1 hypothetical protein GWR21_21135 [Chitinophaga agri]
MKLIVSLSICVSLLAACKSNQTTTVSAYYSQLHEKQIREYQKFFTFDTVINKGSYKAYMLLPKQNVHYCGTETSPVILEKPVGEKKRYYALDAKTDFINDSTIVHYTRTLKRDRFSNTFEEGVWFYAHPDKKHPMLEVNKMPPTASKIPVVNGPGIYRYESDSLYRVTEHQTDAALFKLRKEGYYYLPPPGRLFKLYSINEIR